MKTNDAILMSERQSLYFTMTINTDVSNKSNARKGQSSLDGGDLECGAEEIKCQYLATKINNALQKNSTYPTTFFDIEETLS